MGRLFGTDGIRGIANVDLTPTLAYELGRAVGYLLDGEGRSVVVGQDTRRSGDMLVAALAAGLTSVGSDTVELGVVTTPGLTYVAASGPFAAGIMVSASHNPAEDNGLKVISGGRKVDDEAEDQLEHLIFQAESLPSVPNPRLGRVTRDAEAIDAYRAHLVEAAGEEFAGLRMAVDCANGSASAIAPQLFTDLGAEVTVLFAEPDGTNINAGCGSTHPEALAGAVRDGKLDVGFAFDGDADRLIAADERGALLDGDAIMGICALDRLAAGTLHNNLLVVSVMSNGGLERVITEAGGSILRTQVGDRHVIFRERATTGDGLLTAIELVRALRASGVSQLSTLAARIPRLPQVVINSAVRHKDQWQIDPEFGTAVSRAADDLRGRGRILVRPSGTEPKLRIMVEGDDPDEIDVIARELARLAEARLN
jgi:phosphoglucosamine mutase